MRHWNTPRVYFPFFSFDPFASHPDNLSRQYMLSSVADRLITQCGNEVGNSLTFETLAELTRHLQVMGDYAMH